MCCTSILITMCQGQPAHWLSAGIGYYMRPFLGSEETGHAVLGTVVLICGLSQVVAGVLRPKPVRSVQNSAPWPSPAAGCECGYLWEILKHLSCNGASAGPQTAPLVGSAASQQWPAADRHCSGADPRYLALLHCMLCRPDFVLQHSHTSCPAAARSQSASRR